MAPARHHLIAPTIPGKFVFDALQACGHRTVDSKRLLATLGIDATALNVPGHRVSALDYARLVESIIQETDDGFLGFLDDPIPVRAFSVFAAQMAACNNLKELLGQTNRFFHLFTQQFRFRVEEHPHTTIIALEFNETQAFDYRFIYQSILLVMVRLMRWLLGEHCQPTRVTFSFDSANLDRYLGYLFDCPLRFSSPRNEIHLATDRLHEPYSTTLQQIDVMLRDSTRMMLISDKPAPYTRRVREELLSRKAETWPGIDEIASTLGLSKNQLWRKLKKEDTNFLQIRNAAKRDFALARMTQLELRISDVAEETGFSDTSAFNKAFTEWTGHTPTQYRKKLTYGRSDGQSEV